jgi:FKBP-type peptidyl-prolyl cis-trans isomerase
MRVLKVLVLFAIVLQFSSCGSEEFISPQEQLERDVAEIDAYLEREGIDAVEDPSGIRYVFNSMGSGRSANISNSVSTNYEGRFFDGAVFDEGDDVSFPVSGVIVGWQIMLTQMQEGDDVTVYIPSGLAYGTRGQGSIPPNTNLIFDIELLEVF